MLIRPPCQELKDNAPTQLPAEIAGLYGTNKSSSQTNNYAPLTKANYNSILGD